MNAFIKIARQFALTLTVVATLAGSGVIARGEGGGVGSGGYPPPKMGVAPLTAITPDYALYADGTRLYNNGVILYANGTVGRLAGT